MKVIEIRELKKCFGLRTILDHLDFSVEENEFVAIEGASGSGKSTLINIIGMLDRQYEGSYLFLGNDAAEFSERRRTDIRNGEIGYVFQMGYLIDEYTVRDNILLPVSYQKKKRVDEAYYKSLLELLRIAPIEKRKVRELSGGERQRVGIARSLINRPKLVVADEPTGNLDEENTEAVFSLLQQLNQNGVAVVMVTHDRRLAKLAHKRYALREGKLVCE